MGTGMASRSAFWGLALAVLLLARPARAEETFTVSGIHVDASGPSSTEAMNAAIAGGRVKAFQIVYRRLTRQADWPRQPNLDTAGLTRLSRGFNVANERRNTTRYVADVTYIFNPDAVTRLLRSTNIAYTTQTSARRILVVAMAPNVTHGPWAQALAAQHDSQVPFTLAGPEDDVTLGPVNFDSASWANVAAAAGRIHATEAALVQAVYANGKVTVNIRRLGQNQASAKTSTDVPLLSTVATTYPAAAQAAVSAIEDLWKARVAIDYGQRARLTADLRLSSLSQWGQVQNRLAGISNVTGVQLVAMNTGYARLTLAYVGSTDQLREAMSGAGLSLVNRGGQWMLGSGAP
jgi:hypothetical protein